MIENYKFDRVRAWRYARTHRNCPSREQHQSFKITPYEKHDDHPDSPVHDNDYTKEEWRLLNDLYDDVFPTSQTEDKTNESLANDSHNVILGSEERTPMPSPLSGQNLNFRSPLTEDLVDALNKEIVPI
ncbi:unnamed protein product [Euphydryas editha]|uniref:Uncharacterized protein n=1 Tax=Euphydryas editha TaxID=104508 RepID=A0AAU9UE16_EUPED|nr:unnamed protein product [Euphydryas editha]